MTKKQEKEITAKMHKTLEQVRFEGFKNGAKGILGAVLEMCNDGKTIADIKEFCEKSLKMEGMK